MKPLILEHIEALGYKVFDSDNYDLNLFGIRVGRDSNKFDDIVGCAYKDEGAWRVEYWRATTDPGFFYLENPHNIKGTAILVPGQYRGVWSLDYHQGKSLALCQRNGEVKVYRDANRDRILNMNKDTISEGFYGINIHQAGKISSRVDRWSAGCQVLARQTDFERLLFLCKRQIEIHGWDKFTYTLLDASELNNKRFV